MHHFLCVKFSNIWLQIKSSMDELQECNFRILLEEDKNVALISVALAIVARFWVVQC
jgi:hypothetical protein